jgi:hypothetical protein
MSRQINDLDIYPLTDQVVQVVVDQTNYDPAISENKIIIRTPDHYPLDVDTTHTSIKDGYGLLLEVLSTDPLSVKTSGFTNLTFDGYDGLVIGADGYVIARGVIKEHSSDPISLVDPAYCSIDGHKYIMGGVDVDIDGYTNHVWHSTTGLVWERFGTPPWSARANARLVSDGTDMWLLGGWAGPTPIADIWHAEINTATGGLTWDETAVATNVGFLTDYFKATIHPGTAGPDAYVGAGGINLSTGATSALPLGPLGDDGYDSVIHYDETRNILWYSKDGIRDEYIIGDNGEHIYTANPTGVYGYVHYQSTAASVWDITHNLGSTEVAPVCYTSDKEFLEPNNATWIDENNLKLHFNSSVSGRALVCHAKYYTGSTWNLTDGYIDNNTAWNIIGTSGGILEPATAPSDSQLTWNGTSTDGYMIAWEPYDGIDTMAGRRYISSDNMIQGDNYVAMYQQANAPLTWFRANTVGTTPGVLIEPSSFDYSDSKNAIATFSAPETNVRWCSFNLRHDGYQDNQDPYDTDFINLGVNDTDRDICYLFTDDGVWGTGDAGVIWTRKAAADAHLPTDRLSPVTVQGNTIEGISAGYSLTRSLTGGVSFTQIPGALAIQTITWYGDLQVPVDTSYRLFIYKRPSDVIWESFYGYLPAEFNDNYTTHYVLPYPTTIDSSNSQAVSITLDSAYGRDVTANEFEDDWIYLITAATGAVVDRKQIIRNTAGSAGSSITIYPKEFSVTPTASHVVQIVKNRAEGPVYTTALTRETSRFHTLYHETDGTSFLSNQERTYDYYAHLLSNGGLPYIVQTSENKERINTLHAELNRQRVMNRQFFNDQDTLPPELLERLGHQIGADIDENLDLQTQRRIVSLWHERINSYGPCLDGVNNLIDLVLGPESGVTSSVANPNSDTMAGQVLTITASNYGDYNFNYSSSTNTLLYDPLNSKWGMAVDVTEVPADLSSLVHRSLVHFRGAVVDGPFLITNHGYNSLTNAINVFFDEPDITQLSLSTDSVLAIYSEPKQRTLFKFISLLKQLLPHWVQIKIV